MSEETQVNPEQTTDEVVDTPAVEEPKVHPAYEKLLSELPEAWHSKITPHLQEQDKYFQQQLEKYTPFKDLVDEGVSAEVIKGGLSLARAIDEDPVTVYNNLQGYLRDQGLLAAEAKQAAQEIMEEQSGDDFDEMFDEENIPAALKRELEQLRARQDENDGYIYEQELARATDAEIAKLDAEMDELRTQYEFKPAHEVAIWDIMNAALQAGRQITLSDAVRQLGDMIGGFAPASPAGSDAPTIVGSSGGAGVVAPNLTIPKDDAGKKAMMAQMFEQYKQANR